MIVFRWEEFLQMSRVEMYPHLNEFLHSTSVLSTCWYFLHSFFYILSSSLLLSLIQVVQLLRQSVSSSCPPVFFDPSHSIFSWLPPHFVNHAHWEERKSFLLSGSGSLVIIPPHFSSSRPSSSLWLVCFTFASSSLHLTPLFFCFIQVFPDFTSFLFLQQRCNFFLEIKRKSCSNPTSDHQNSQRSSLQVYFKAFLLLERSCSFIFTDDSF